MLKDERALWSYIPMKPLPIVCAGAALVTTAFSESAAKSPAWLFNFSSGPEKELLWQTKPGHRYDLWESTSLMNWSRVSGFPKVADGLVMEHSFSPSPAGKGFFRIDPIDEQPPVVTARFPEVNGFAVGRFADISVELDDATGVDFSSIRLTIEGTGPLAPGAPGLTIVGKTISYDSGDVALGAWGAMVTATLVAEDTLGNTLTTSWSFRLEPEPLAAANLFVFGSPTAQRAGQRVSGPTADLASRLPLPAGPVKANDPPPWNIASVAADRIVISYGEGGPPAFPVGQLVCNLAPKIESEIFYRRVVSTNDDPATKRLTVMTVEAVLTDFATRGASSFSENSVIYDVDDVGAISSAVDGTLEFPPVTIDLSGSSYRLRSDGYEVSLLGIGTYSNGSAEPWLGVELPEFRWSFHPSIRAGLEIDFGGLKSFEAIARGTNSMSTAIEANVNLIGATTETTLYDLPPGKEPFKLIYLGQIGPVPVWAALKFDWSIKSKAQASSILEFDATYRQEHWINALGLSYHRGDGVRLVRDVQSSSPDLKGNASVGGAFSLELTTDPRVEFLVYGLAGMKAGIEGKAELLTTASSGTGLDGHFGVQVDGFVGTAGPAFDLLGIDRELSWIWWEGEWQLAPQTLSFKTHPKSIHANPGDDVSFTCAVDGPPAVVFQWYRNGIAIPGQSSRTLSLRDVTSGHAGSYFVRAESGGLRAYSDTAALSVEIATPSNQDSDSDGVPDVQETNTGIWVSSSDRGTAPNNWDSDGDGLSDKVETNTGILLSRSDTGTNPNKLDTNENGESDKSDIDAGRNPNPAAGDILFADDFNGSIKSQWLVKRRDDQHLAIGPSSLRIRADWGDLWTFRNDSKNTFLVPGPAKSKYTISCALDNLTIVSANYAQMALLIYDDDDNYFKFSYVSVDGAMRLELASEVGGVFSSKLISPLSEAGTNKVRMSIIKQDWVYVPVFTVIEANGLEHSYAPSFGIFGDGTPEYVGFFLGVDPLEISTVDVDRFEIISDE